MFDIDKILKEKSLLLHQTLRNHLILMHLFLYVLPLSSPNLLYHTLLFHCYYYVKFISEKVCHFFSKNYCILIFLMVRYKHLRYDIIVDRHYIWLSIDFSFGNLYDCWVDWSGVEWLISFGACVWNCSCLLYPITI